MPVVGGGYFILLEILFKIKMKPVKETNCIKSWVRYIIFKDSDKQVRT